MQAAASPKGAAVRFRMRRFIRTVCPEYARRYGRRSLVRRRSSAQPRLGRPFDSCGLFVSAAGRPVDFVRQQIHRLFRLFGHSVDAGVDLFLVHCEECFFEERARSDAIQSRTTAPMTDAIRLPSVPTATSPSSDRIQPPRIPPTMPTIRLTTSPEPCPLTRRLASQPATSR